MQDAESHSLRGAIDAGALNEFRAEFERLEPLASGLLDDPVSPGELRLRLDDGIGEATTVTVTVRWSGRDDDNVHYSDDSDRDLRWDVHQHEYTDPEGHGHNHPPPNASSNDDNVEASCLELTELVFGARVHRLWRAGDGGGTPDPRNDARSHS
jgi:hypothetical protein